MTKIDSMIAAFRVRPTVSGRGLCDINRLLIIFAESVVKKMESPDKVIPIAMKIEEPRISAYFIRAGSSQFFDTQFSNSQYYSIDITQYASAGCRTHTKWQNHGISPQNLDDL